jgi:DNA-binding beta-propeller fold protein YncE
MPETLMPRTIKPAHRRGGALLALVALLGVAPLALGLGELSQKPGTAGCMSETGSGGACHDGKALDQAFGVVATADGRNAYIASSDAVAVFERDSATGTLIQKQGVAGCVSQDGTGGLCRVAAALDSAIAVAASRDGKNVYVASPESDAVAVFDRDPATGTLTPKPGTAGCVSEDGSGGGCQDGTALDFTSDVPVSPDGTSVYVAGRGSAAVAVFDGDPVSGALTQKPGTAGCISETGSGGACQDGTALDGVAAVVVSPDGTNVYTVSASADAVAVFDRDPATGALAQKPGTAGCISETGSGGACQDGTALTGPFFMTVTGDGRSIYVTSSMSDAVAVFDRDPTTGALTQKPGTAGCISEDGSGGACQNGAALDTAASVAASPDGTSVYVAAAGSDAIAVFDRDPTTGALTQKTGLACVSETGSGACADGTNLDNAAGVATSPDGANVYVTAVASNAVAIFDRPTPSPRPSQPPAPPDTLAPTVTRFAVTPSRFRVARAATAIGTRASGRSRRAHRGSRLRFTLSERADARIAIARAGLRHHAGRHCKGHRCTGYKLVGTLTRGNLPAGRTRIRFSGRIGTRALARGHYRATVKATDPAGSRSRAIRATFSVVRPREAGLQR